MSHTTSPFRSHQELTETFAHVQRRIADKIGDYKNYAFSQSQSRAFNVFFDLAQEFDPVEDLLTLAVLILRSMCNIHAEIYVLDEHSTPLRYCCSTGPECAIPQMDTEGLPLTDGPFLHEGRYCIPIRGKKVDIDLLPITPIGETLGILVLHPKGALSSKKQLFFEKFANRVGYQLHNRLLSVKHREHLEFVKNLVHDIGHNVIVPNLYFKLLFKQLDGKMKSMRLALGELTETSECSHSLTQLNYIQHRMDEQYQEVYKHFQQTSLFLETLLRQSHFEKGRYVLHKSVVNLHDRIITPQLERFKARLEEKNITILPYCDTQGEPDRTAQITVDVGLISQVLANLLSNAVKYTRSNTERRECARLPKSSPQALPETLPDTLPDKYLCYSITRHPGYFGNNIEGVRVSIITSGPLIADDDAPQLFHSDFRGKNVGNEYGTGHGLFFAQEIAQLHGGDAGYTVHPQGNCFYFTLPCADTVP